MDRNETLTEEEQRLFDAASEKKEEKTGGKTDIEKLKEQYAGSGTKVYVVTNTVQVDDETEEEFTYLFRKPKPASYDRYVKLISNSASKASKTFAFDNIVSEQTEQLRADLDEYPAMAISLADKLLRMLGLADTTSVKKL